MVFDRRTTKMTRLTALRSPRFFQRYSLFAIRHFPSSIFAEGRMTKIFGSLIFGLFFLQIIDGHLYCLHDCTHYTPIPD
jgi:hypothetical protein